MEIDQKNPSHSSNFSQHETNSRDLVYFDLPRRGSFSYSGSSEASSEFERTINRRFSDFTDEFSQPDCDNYTNKENINPNLCF